MRSLMLGLSLTTMIVVTGLPVSDANSAGASSNYGRTVCHYLKQRAQTADDPKRRKSLMKEYRRCLKEQGEG